MTSPEESWIRWSPQPQRARREGAHFIFSWEDGRRTTAMSAKCLADADERWLPPWLVYFKRMIANSPADAGSHRAQ